MNQDFPPLIFPDPQVLKRKAESKYFPPSPEVISRRAVIADRLNQQLAPLSARLQQLTEEQRRAVFFKIEHDGPVPLVGTGLKPITEASQRVTLAIPREESLEKFVARVQEFGTGELTRGQVKFPELARIESVTQGTPTDRLSVGLLENYEQLTTSEWVNCEIEMLSVKAGSKQRRRELETFREALMAAFQAGTRGNFFEHEEDRGTVRAVIRCSGELFRELVESEEWQTKITWFEERPEFETFSTIVANFDVAKLQPLRPPGDGAPTACIIDSGVSAGNPFLSVAVIPEMQESFLDSSDDPSDSTGHGSAVASLAAYYALNLADGSANEPKVRIASAKVLAENNELEDGRLFSKILREAVEFFVPRGIRVFNLSVNDFNLRWNDATRRTVPRKSWTARQIDRMSKEFDITFVISAGNLSANTVAALMDDGFNYPAYWADESTTIHDPAQSALAITVGSIAASTTIVGPGGRTSAIAEKNEPSPFTRRGPGIRREIKPEVVEYGGNYGQQDGLPRVQTNRGLDSAVASHALTPPIAYTSGTSLAAPRAAHKLCRVLADLQEIEDNLSSVLLRAFFINSCLPPLNGGPLNDFGQSLGDPKLLANIVGYGIPDDQRATYCDEYSALMYFQGELESNSVALFDVPVPEVLVSARGKKKLTVTLAYAPDVQRWGLEEYFSTVLKWRMFRGDISRDDVIAAMSETEGEPNATGTADTADEESEDERPSEIKFERGVTLRSRGAIQFDTYEWSIHRQEFSANNYTLAVGSYKRWNRTPEPPTRFGIIVRLEEMTGSTPVYADVAATLARVRAQARARA